MWEKMCCTVNQSKILMKFLRLISPRNRPIWIGAVVHSCDGFAIDFFGFSLAIWFFLVKNFATSLSISEIKKGWSFLNLRSNGINRFNAGLSAGLMVVTLFLSIFLLWSFFGFQDEPYSTSLFVPFSQFRVGIVSGYATHRPGMRRVSLPQNQSSEIYGCIQRFRLTLRSEVRKSSKLIPSRRMNLIRCQTKRSSSYPIPTKYFNRCRMLFVTYPYLWVSID